MARNRNGGRRGSRTDFGNQPLVMNIDRLTKRNPNFRTALWTGDHLQLTLMSIPSGGDIGAEMHENVDQFIRVEEGVALVMTGDRESELGDRQKIDSDYAIIIPAGTWHNIINIGNMPLKLYSIYAPPQHPYGTVHRTKEEAEHH